MKSVIYYLRTHCDASKDEEAGAFPQSGSFLVALFVTANV